MDYWILSLVLGLISYIIFKAYEKRKYFQKWGIPHPPEIPFLGAMGANVFVGPHFCHFMRKIYNVNKEAKYVGCNMFLKPMIFVRDLDLAKSIFVKNFEHFPDRVPQMIDEAADPLFAKNLAFLNGEKWHEVRHLLSPAFTSSKMRNMFTFMSKCAKNYVDNFFEIYSDKDIDMKDALTRYTNDVIATCAFGIECDSLKDPHNEFYVSGKRVATFKSIDLIKICLARAFPSLSRKFGLSIVSKKDCDFFTDLIRRTVKTRQDNGITRPDMLQLIMDALEEKEDLNFLEATAQAFVFFLGGFETTSGQLCLIAHELAVNPDVQEKLQSEIDAVMEKAEGVLSYDDVNHMGYLDAIFNETLRMHSISLLSRRCAKEFELPPALPGSKPYKLKPGMEVMIPVSGIHYDPEYYESPDKFDPERYLNKAQSHNDILNLGFGIGPRMCIGNRFAILEAKVLLVYLLHKCSLVPCKKTIVPLKYDKFKFLPTAKGGFWLSAKPRN